MLEGALEHKDSMGTGSIIRPGDVQRMSAGTGVQHSEFNASKTEPVHFLQIWILPEQSAASRPATSRRRSRRDDEARRLRVVASPDGRDGSVTIHADARRLRGPLRRGRDGGARARARPQRLGARRDWGRHASTARSSHAGDGAALTGVKSVHIEGVDGGGEVLVFDLG